MLTRGEPRQWQCSRTDGLARSVRFDPGWRIHDRRWFASARVRAGAGGQAVREGNGRQARPLAGNVLTVRLATLPLRGLLLISMAVQTEELLSEDLDTATREIVDEFRRAVSGGDAWYLALFDAVARWRLPQEWVEGRYHRYLIGGEAFDWLLLAERLLDTVSDLVPGAEQEALLFHGRLPIEQSAEEFRNAIGAAKHRAHLNYLYGVVVEEALQLAVEEDVHKELRCQAWGQARRVDEAAFERIYGKSREELLAEFREQHGRGSGEIISLPELQEFTYWLFKYRMRQCDRAKVASDTRRGLAQISLMEQRRRLLAADLTPPSPENDTLIDARAALA